MNTHAQWLERPALFVVVLVGFYFVVLAVAALMKPSVARRFLLGFAGSARAHYAELTLRVVVGGAFILVAHRLAASYVWSAFGWVLVLTSLLLLCLPWQWHQRFAKLSVPAATRSMALIGLGSALAGASIWLAVFMGG